MEFKARVTHIPAVTFHDDQFLKVDTTFNLTACRDLRGASYSPMAMLEQTIAQQVPGAGSMLKGDYDLSVSIGQLFDIEESTKALKKAFDLVIGKRVWLVASYDGSGRLIFTFSQQLWRAADGVIIHGTEKRNDIDYTQLGKELAFACVEEEDNGITLLSPRSMAFYVKEEDLPEALPRLHGRLSTLLPASGHTIEWVSPDSQKNSASMLDGISSE